MADPITLQQEASTSTTTTVTVVAATDGQPPETVQLTLRRPRTERKVQWTNETVDNEHMNKKKSKCCCIYKKPKKFDESSSEDSDDECDHCGKHVEKKKLKSQAQEEATAAAAETLTEVLDVLENEISKNPNTPDG